MYTLDGIDNTTRQATTNKQVEILFKFIVVLFSADVSFLLCTSREILNSLKLRYINGKNRVITKIIRLVTLEMIMSIAEIVRRVV